MLPWRLLKIIVSCLLCLSQFRCLRDKAFEIIARGEIEVKGKGKMCTYFLMRNSSAQENEILGRPGKETDSGRESSQVLHDELNKGSLQMACPQGKTV